MTDSKIFSKASPVWFPGREREMNLFAGFRATFTAERAGMATLRYTGASLCRVFVNGHFAAHGPARGPHGFFRIDEIPLVIQRGANTVAIEVAAYNTPTYYTLNVPAFLQAEVVDAEGRVLAATMGEGSSSSTLQPSSTWPTNGAIAPFMGQVLDYRVQKVPKFSLQRPFMEVWRLGTDSTSWRTGGAPFTPQPLSVVASGGLLPRGAPYPEYAVIPATAIASGRATPPPAGWRYDGGDKEWMLRQSFAEDVGHFPPAEVEVGALSYAIGAKFVPDASVPLAGPLAADEWRIYDLGRNLSGFLAAKLRTSGPARLAIVFDELLRDGDVPLHRIGCNNVADIILLDSGEYDFAIFDPITCRYAKVAVIEGNVGVEDFRLVEYANPEASRASFHASDGDIDAVFEAARETFRQNAVDIFTDCPSRERAGWLCDSFFIGRAALDFCGNSDMERTFLENFAISKYTGDIPDAVFPMCYPGDHINHNFIPNWAMWFVIELEEYVARSGDNALAEALKPRVLAFLSYLATFENSDGLLEKLPAWVFVEWSRANALVQDVNYPSNMTYAGVLAAAGRLYGEASLTDKSARVAETIRAQSYDGLFFRDHAVRGEDGVLAVDPERTEVCQYYAFFFGVATPEVHSELWKVLRDDFGPFRRETGAYPDVAFANAFIGNYLRLELLSRAGLSAQILRECKGYFKKMADLTGTLWEMDSPTASCCHGFASHAASMILRDVLGIRRVDAARKTAVIAIPADLPLEWCEGSRPVADGEIRVSWRRVPGSAPEVEVSVPAGWKWHN